MLFYLKNAIKMNNKEIIKDILIEELSKCNNFNYKLKFNRLHLTVNTKKLYQSLIDNSFGFEGGINSKWRFKQYMSKNFYILTDIWSKIEKETQLKYTEIQSILKDILEETFKIKGITPYRRLSVDARHMEEAFKIKGITPATNIFSQRSINIGR